MQQGYLVSGQGCSCRAPAGVSEESFEGEGRLGCSLRLTGWWERRGTDFAGRLGDAEMLGFPSLGSGDCRDIDGSGLWVVAAFLAQKLAVIGRQLAALVDLERIGNGVVDVIWPLAKNQAAAFALDLALRIRGAMHDLRLNGLGELAAGHQMVILNDRRTPHVLQ